MPKFEKTYSRDTSLIIQQAWFRVFENDAEYFGWSNPHRPAVMHVLRDGVVEVWENLDATAWHTAALRARLETDGRFFEEAMRSYEQRLVQLAPYWSKGKTEDLAELTRSIELIFAATFGFIVMYYASLDETLPAAIRQRALALRETDTFFDQNDRLIRQSLLAFYPELAGLESGILRSEIHAPPSAETLRQRQKVFTILGETPGPMPATFEKKYSRESTFIPQEIWMQTSLLDLPERFGNLGYPKPAILLDCADGNVDIWINVAYQEWMVANAGRTYGQDLALVEQTIATYKNQLRVLGERWSQAEATVDGFKETLKLMREALTNLHTLFYVITCEDSLQAARDAAMEVRSEDRFFVDAEIYVQQTLKNLLPNNQDLIWFVTVADLDAELDLAKISQRREKFVFVDGVAQGPISLKEYCAQHPEISLIDIAKDAENIREFKGQIAQPGLVTGKVRIVRKKEHATLVEAGEVIVAAMTTPDFLPAMKKAAAFVTDEGGITCHAAIVSRELGKPCIIGTKIATKVLKDGDMVEVDATTGIVKILNRK